ncbi:hypothetical protein GCM10027589_25040 [Actinocorallia lasiicapitis]
MVGSVGWRASGLMVSLSGLSTREVRAYARAEGLPETVHGRLAQVTHGHPVADGGAAPEPVRRA